MNELALMLHSSRFGDLAVSAEDVLHFPDRLIGLAGTDYVLLPAGCGPFTWCHSMSDPALALVLTRPERFFPAFELELADTERDRLGAEADAPGDVFVTVRAGADPAACTANLKAPIIILGEPGSGVRHAHQVINQAPGAALRASLF